MRLWVRVYWLAKQGLTEKEYEDAALFLPGKHVTRCAVADGASETSYAGLWAEMLCNAYVKGELRSKAWTERMSALCREWQGKTRGKPLPWYAEEKVAMGAHAAFLGLSLFYTPRRGLRLWQAVALGDCCLYHVRTGTVKTCFPLSFPQQFTNRPTLISSRAQDAERALQQLQKVGGQWEPGDEFFLMSDALAKWFAEMVTGGAKPWDVWQDVQDGAEFARRIVKLRREQELKNDDVTLIHLRMG